MEFRPCIDIHNGKVKQIVGSSLKDAGSFAVDNYVSEKGGAYYANLFKEYGLKGGHIILLNKEGTEYFEATRKVAFDALTQYPGALQIGGGITCDNAYMYLEAGAQAVIVTSYVFNDGVINWDRLEKLKNTVGKEHIVLDLSCRRVEDKYYIATNRWQNISDEELSVSLMEKLTDYSCEYLIHAVDVEGKSNGIEEKLVSNISVFDKIPVTYAGGVSSLADIELLGRLCNGKMNVTVGSALDIYGGPLNFGDVVNCCRNFN